MLSPALATLLDDARAEAKRAGHAAVAPHHLAAALARRAPEAFDAAFGAGAAAKMRALAVGPPPPGSDADTVAILEAAGSDEPAAVIAALRERLGPLTDLSDHQPPATAPAQRDAPPSPPPPAPGRTGALLTPVAPDPAIGGFDQLLDQIIAMLSMRKPATPLVQGSRGSGKSSVAAALAARLADASYAGPLKGFSVVRVDTAAVLSDDPIASLDRALDAQGEREIVIVDDLESLLSLGFAATILPMFVRLRGAVSDPSRRLILIVEEAYASRLATIDEELSAALTPVEIPLLPVESLWDIARKLGAELAAHHGVSLSDAILRLAASPRAESDRVAHPGLITERLDRACARAAMREDKQVHEQDLGLQETPEVAPLDAEALVEHLRRRVRGQDQALAPVAARLALTRAQLDLRPARPDGVFLFVGPTGVGKTELARALCEALFGEEERLVRLDMSEYAEPWALSRLIGPQPGYVGYTEPEGWLTTRIRKQPDTVLLLDEIEKAHPTVWNAFLQVFDAGRLSDARGNVADFEHTVIAMTSNLGTGGPAPIGFAQDDEASATTRDAARVIDAVKQAMSPELINRLDEIVVFRPLTREAIREIAELELERMRARLAERGYVITIGAGVIELVAETGYDPAYGARHLQRNVERLLLEPLANVHERELTAEAVDGQIVWRPR